MEDLIGVVEFPWRSHRTTLAATDFDAGRSRLVICSVLFHHGFEDVFHLGIVMIIEGKTVNHIVQLNGNFLCGPFDYCG